MTHNTGQAFLLKISDGSTPPVYNTVAGARVAEISVARELMAVSAVVIFLSSDAEAQVLANAITGTLAAYELYFEDGWKLRGQSLIHRSDYVGEYNGERHYFITLSNLEEVEVT